MKKAREPIWWIPLLRRVLGWGSTMALLWLLPTLLITRLVAVFLPIEITVLPLYFATFCFGSITGAACAVCAPPTDFYNPFESPVFRTAGLDTFFYLVGFGGLFNLAVDNSDVVSFIGRFVPILLFQTVLVGVLFVFCLWLSLTRALRSTKLK